MKVYLNRITGIDDAITSMYFSKRSWNRNLEDEIRFLCHSVLTADGTLSPLANKEAADRFTELFDKVTKWGRHHITMLRFIDFSFTVEGLHRAGQDDWDAHSYRFNNRIIRNSTRLAEFNEEVSDWYSDKILTDDQAVKKIGIDLPESITVDGATYLKRTNGYIKEEYADNPDVKRGLYMLSIPSSFIYKIQCTEFAHVYKERYDGGGANPEVKLCCEMQADLLEKAHSQLNRQLWMDIKN